ncbi:MULTISPECIES: ABC transporter permease [unclassified Arcicella]|uniref:ABC transporter permease n=1 Tax=unclassified Arcicella TaxID=2644986 RepID=UPI00286776F1|nr:MULTISPECIES: ABC transporter permease [unclassified Arcicella]MDR6563868.1 ABC-type antimicrobial peptide transport system permease subunit [Arcicella sp. BE51]MDR6813621.1 ABC-type antimicrobial peptide transport system permease subunit [Arcicella sp. BE140]MDR6824998.1 ABC-type antimicrobial peptide transport system permease subunit [Arcicella sp. BE139]
MLKNYLKIALRTLLRHKVYSFINIAGLATGMAVAMLIGLWIWDELSYDKYHEHYDRIAQVMQHNIYNGEKATQESNPAVMAEEIRSHYGSDFKYVLQSSWTSDHILTFGEKKLTKSGNYFEPKVTEMLTLKMLKGTREGLKEPYSILLSESVAKAYFGDTDPMEKLMKIDNKTSVKVTGVYEDLPYNSSFRDMSYILPWELYLITNDWIKKMDNPWGSNFTQTFAELADNADFDKVSKKIINVKFNNLGKEEKRYKPEVFLQPMSNWHLYSDFKNGVNIGGRIQFVWLFGIIGIFVLLLACINFMNLSTARSEKRAKEVGVRKAIGSARAQLIAQFLSESLLVVAFAFGLSILLVQLFLPFFNEVADKKMNILWTNPFFWLTGIFFTLITGLIAGSYPALYLSSFQPVKVLKGTFKVGRYATIPRKVLVVIQFTVSVTLIIGTIIVFRQIEHAKNRPIGYNRDGLIIMNMATPDIHDHFETVRSELKSSGAIVEMTESGSPTTEVWNTNGGFEWEGKDPNLAVDFPNNGVTYEYGKTIGWQFVDGRDFSREYATDSLAFVLNQAAVKFIGLKNPIGTTLKWNGKPFKIVGVIKDMVVQSPYQPVRPSLFHISKDQENVIILKINPNSSSREALSKIETVFRKYNPAAPFEYKFVDDQYARKFGNEERIGKLATFFAILAIFISCLGIFGLASFTAEQRTKEIGVRKVLGASVFNLWQLLSKDFVVLVMISILIASPISYFFMNNWIEKYNYRTDISWWIFGLSGLGALVITLATVSYQAIKAASANPVKSLRTE